MSVEIMGMVWKNARDIQGNDLVVLLALADWSNDQGVCWPSVNTLAEKARVSVRTVQYILRRLTDGGYISVQENRGRNHVNNYLLNLHLLIGKEKVQTLQVIEPEKVQDLHILSEEKVQSQVIKGATAIAPNTSVNHHKESMINRESEKIEIAEPTPQQLREMLSAQSAEKAAIQQALFDGACGVLDKTKLTKDQQGIVNRFFDKYGLDPRLDVALVEFARYKCSKRGIPDLDYWQRVMSDRLDNPQWVNLAEEKAALGGERKQTGGNGNGSGKQGYLTSSERNADNVKRILGRWQAGDTRADYRASPNDQLASRNTR